MSILTKETIEENIKNKINELKNIRDNGRLSDRTRNDAAKEYDFFIDVLLNIHIIVGEE